MIQGFLKKLFRMPEFAKEDDVGLSDLLLGSHSIRKFEATVVRKYGITKDEKEIRGRWKGAGRASPDVYEHVELPYPDAKVAEKLCVVGALCTSPVGRHSNDEHFCSEPCHPDCSKEEAP
jgi:hypothetical protein